MTTPGENQMAIDNPSWGRPHEHRSVATIARNHPVVTNRAPPPRALRMRLSSQAYCHASLG